MQQRYEYIFPGHKHRLGMFKTAWRARNSISNLPKCWTNSHNPNISRSVVGNTLVDHWDEVGTSPVGTAPTASSFSIKYMSSTDWAKTTERRDDKYFSLGILVQIILEVLRYYIIAL